jgi:hypothetical protein
VRSGDCKAGEPHKKHNDELTTWSSSPFLPYPPWYHPHIAPLSGVYRRDVNRTVDVETSPGDGLRVDVNVVILSICCYTRLSIERVSLLEGRYQSEEEVVEGSFLVSGRQD